MTNVPQDPDLPPPGTFLKERLFRLPLRGVVGIAVCGVAFLGATNDCHYEHPHLPPLRHFVTPVSAPIEGSCRHCRLWGVFLATNDRHYEYLLSVIYFCILLTVYHRLICRSDNSAAADNFFKSMCAPADNS